MGNSKQVAKKPKAVTSKKVSARNNTSTSKPIKLGGVPNQGKIE